MVVDIVEKKKTSNIYVYFFLCTTSPLKIQSFTSKLYYSNFYNYNLNPLRIWLPCRRLGTARAREGTLRSSPPGLNINRACS